MSVTKLIPFSILTLSVLAPTSTAQKIDYATQVRPILESRCYRCHGEEEQEADLRLDKRQFVFGPGAVEVIVPGDAEKSELYYRVSLPIDDPDVMPSEGDTLTEQQVAVLKQWILEGAEWPEQDHVAEAEPEAEPKRASLDLPALDDAAISARDAVLAKLSKIGASAGAIAADTPAVEVNASLLGKKFGDEQMAMLAGLENSLVWLNLARSGVTDRGLAAVGSMSHLRRLDLSRTAISDSGLAAIGKLAHLDYLNLYGTKVTDEGLAHLRGMKSLQKVFLWGTKVTPDGAKALAAALPEATIDTGGYADVIAQVSNAQKPANDMCPLTDKKVDPAYVLRSEGTVVGFCCEKCRAKFAADPAEYADKVKASIKPADGDKK